MWWAKSTTTKLVPSIVMTIPQRRISVALIIMAVRALIPWVSAASSDSVRKGKANRGKPF